jgi:C4-dicarboxylate transporter DctQ subunit
MFTRWLNHIEEWLIAVFMAAATLIIFAAVLHRYSAGIPWLWHYTRHIEITWAQEACIYLFIWMAKFGAAYGVRTGIHVGVDVLVRTLSAAWQRTMVIFSLLSGAAFTGTVAWLGVRFVHRIHQTGQVSPDLEMPMWIIYLAIPLGSSLMCWRFLEVLIGYLKTGELPHHDHGALEDAPA